MTDHDTPTTEDKGPWIALEDPSTANVGEQKPTPTPTPVRSKRKLKLLAIVSVVVLLVVIVVVTVAVLTRRTATTITETVDLGYAQYRGQVLANQSNVKAWLGMRYAAAPVGDLRFAEPQDPQPANTTLDAFEHGKKCLAVNDKPSAAVGSAEDCLFIDVYSPADADWNSHHPVYFFIQGGGFAVNGNANYNGQGLIMAAALDMVVVTFNYRVGMYGFLAGSEVDSPNNGLKDQRKALQWVQQHITKFGGDPNHIVLGGDSAGATSVALQMAAYGGKNMGLFHAAAMESPSLATILNNTAAEYLYTAVTNATSCESASDTLACLRGLSVDDIQLANRNYPYPGAAGTPVYSWNPVIDGDFIRDYTYSAFSKGKFVAVPTIVGDDTNGGTIFSPRGADSLEQSNQFLQNTFPYLNQTHIDKINEFYPNDPQDVFPDSGSYWRRTANAYGEIRYMCPSIFLAIAVDTYGKQNNTQAYGYRYNVQDPKQVGSGVGVPHTAEVPAIWGSDNVPHGATPDSYRPGGANAAIIPTLQAYWTSFIRTSNPNTFRYTGAPEWKSWGTELSLLSQGFVVQGDPGSRLLFDTPVTDTRMESIDSGLWERCQYFWSIGDDIHQ